MIKAMNKRVAVIMGSDSDLPVVRKAAEKLLELGIPYEMRVMSAHRTPREVTEFAVSARENGFGVIIAAAGKAAHLAGFIAANTTLPVIGVPLKSDALDGMDALLATVYAFRDPGCDRGYRRCGKRRAARCRDACGAGRRAGAKA